MTMEITNDRLEEAIKQYAAERTKENLTTVLNLLRPTKLYVPAMLKAPDQPTPCFLKNNKGEQFFVAYTSKEQMPEEPKSQALLFMPFPACNNIVVKPELELTLMEPTGKRVDFLKYLCGELGLTGVEFAKERAEEAARKIWREQFDVASARAVAALPVLCEYCLPLVRVGGVFIAMKGPDADAELGGSAAALKKHQHLAVVFAAKGAVLLGRVRISVLRVLRMCHSLSFRMGICRVRAVVFGARRVTCVFAALRRSGRSSWLRRPSSSSRGRRPFRSS